MCIYPAYSTLGDETSSLTRLFEVMWIFFSARHCEVTCLGQRTSDAGFLILQCSRGSVIHSELQLVSRLQDSLFPNVDDLRDFYGKSVL